MLKSIKDDYYPSPNALTSCIRNNPVYLLEDDTYVLCRTLRKRTIEHCVEFYNFLDENVFTYLLEVIFNVHIRR